MTSTMESDRPPRPLPLDVRWDSIPPALKVLVQWVVWRWTWNEKHSKWDKPPLNARHGRNASTTEPKTWVDFEMAKAACQDPANAYDSVGFVFTTDDPFVGIDLDHCRDPDTGVILPWSAEQRACRRWTQDAPEPQQIIDALASYAEVSPSQTGVKIIVEGRVPNGGKAGDFEMYDRGRYFTITGHKLPSAPPAIRRIDG